MLVLLSQMEFSAENCGDFEPTAKAQSSITSQRSGNGKVEGTTPAKDYCTFCLYPQVALTGSGCGATPNGLPYPLAGSAALLFPQVFFVGPRQ